MKKRIIICSDGTWNSPEKKDAGRTCVTNVAKMAQAIQPRDPESDLPQIVFYDQGGGSDTFGWLEGKARRMTGWGLKQNILDCYRFLAHNYERDDEIFLIGFSRGAYTVRSLGGLLDTVGLLSRHQLDRLPEAYAFYRTPHNRRDSSRFREIESLKDQTERPKIQFLGVFDTVGARGIPTPILGQMMKRRVSFHNCKLPATVKHAYQALASDEKRPSFEPAIWTGKGSRSHVQQVWFAGVHGNIGGGYPDCALSDLSFQWMAQRAMECGLAFDETFMSEVLKLNPDPLGLLEDSFSASYRSLAKMRLMKPFMRPIGHHLGVGEMIHHSVVTRLTDNPAYRPENLMLGDASPQDLLGQENGHTTLRVGGVLMPVSMKREGTRRPEHQDATLMLEGEAVQPCKLVDLSQPGGAKIRLETPPQAGQSGSLQSSKVGTRDFRVVWSDSHFAGVQFAAG